jgi:hypothetical protein
MRRVWAMGRGAASSKEKDRVSTARARGRKRRREGGAPWKSLFPSFFLGSKGTRV